MACVNSRPTISVQRPVEVNHATPTSTAVITVVMPMFNEHATLPETLTLVQQFTRDNPWCHFLFIDDGSTDGTDTLLDQSNIPRRHEHAQGTLSPPITWERLATNSGKGLAVAHGIELATTPMVAFMDGDMAYSLDHIPELVEALQSSDVVIGSRHESAEERRNTKRKRRWMGQVFNWIVRVFLSLPYRDTQAGLKAFRSDAARRIFTRKRLSGFSFDVELLFIARVQHLSVAETPARVNRAHRRQPSSVNLATQPMVMMLDLLRIRWNHLLGRYN